jgi:hypothetical protein
MRKLVRENVTWTVHEVDTSAVPGARAPRCLVVESENIVRRVWSYPPNWSAFGDDTLWDILDRMWHAHDGERECLERRARSPRLEMREAAVQYARALRRDGVAPERALVLLKAAVQKGLGVSQCDEDVSNEIIHETVACCIDAYFAA